MASETDLVLAGPSKSRKAGAMLFKYGTLFLSDKLLIFMIALAKLLISVDRTAFSAMLPLLKTQGLENTSLQAGSYGSAVIIGVVVSSMWAAKLSKSHHPLILIAYGQVFWIVAVIFAGLSADYTMLLIARTLTGLSEGAFLTLASPIILELSPEGSKAFYYAICTSAIPIGNSIGYIYGASVGSELGWHPVFFIEALVMAPIALLFVTIYKDPRLEISQATDKTNARSFFGDLKELSRNKLFLCITLGFASLTFTTTGLGYWGPYILKENYGQSDIKSSFQMSLITLLGGIVGTYAGSLYCDFRMKSYTELYNENKVSLEEINAVRCNVTLMACRASAIAAFCVLLPGAIANEVTTYLVCLTIGKAFLMLKAGTVGVATMTCVDKSLRNQAVASFHLVSHFVGLSSPMLVGLMIQLLGIYQAVIALVLCLIPCFFMLNYAWIISSNISTPKQV